MSGLALSISATALYNDKHQSPYINIPPANAEEETATVTAKMSAEVAAVNLFIVVFLKSLVRYLEHTGDYMVLMCGCAHVVGLRGAPEK